MAAVENAEPRTELQELQFKSGQVANESLESTRRMLSLMDESQEAAVCTLVALDHQGGQLDRIEEGMDQINANMRKAEKNLSGMEKFCGICVLPWKKVNTKSDKENAWKAIDYGKIVAIHPQRSPPAQTGYVTRITNVAREDEMDNNLRQVNSMLGNLRNLALDMSSELENQNKQVNRINAKGDDNNIRMDGATKRVKNLLKS
ncbi:synaptosomal-associated protein 25-like [Drosophila rhopaloa]|uniref:t-SNARE coiled-coil homology domain-containing protein n=1 Tax=Drosophila rhopaloa TaxID=1041015 RepID=A0ABM5H629_DRORH|nr:synaptosomal-associated protein 25-like [Drosophila rhopaloa]